jgi:hypothetical protein
MVETQSPRTRGQESREEPSREPPGEPQREQGNRGVQRREGGPRVCRKQGQGAVCGHGGEERVPAQILLELACQDDARWGGREQQVEHVAHVEAQDDRQGGAPEVREPLLGEEHQGNRRGENREAHVEELEDLGAGPGVELLGPQAWLHSEQPDVQVDEVLVNVVRIHEADGVVQVRVDEDAQEEGQHLPKHEQGCAVGGLPSRAQIKGGRAHEGHSDADHAAREPWPHHPRFGGEVVGYDGEPGGGKKEEDGDRLFGAHGEEGSAKRRTGREDAWRLHIKRRDVRRIRPAGSSRSLPRWPRREPPR